MVVIATIVPVNSGESIIDVSPLLNNGALTLANAKAVDCKVPPPAPQLGQVVTVAAPVILWLLF